MFVSQNALAMVCIPRSLFLKPFKTCVLLFSVLQFIALIVCLLELQVTLSLCRTGVVDSGTFICGYVSSVGTHFFRNVNTTLALRKFSFTHRFEYVCHQHCKFS